MNARSFENWSASHEPAQPVARAECPHDADWANGFRCSWCGAPSLQLSLREIREGRSNDSRDR
jgi:hypothetical protein